ncbi:MAG: hypothetical protein HS107_10250 [Thermoflexaceae bacterium]|nr:hypothetical protein [Thermoflexaceae bacterium]
MIFVDRSIPRAVAEGLRHYRQDLVYLDDRFPRSTPDRVWLAEAGRQGWMVITRDKKIRTRPAERRALVESGARCFVLTQKRDPTRQEYIALLVRALPAMERVFATTPAPFLYSVDGTGILKRLA